jgi:signal transduction histidine kinase
VRTRLVAVFAVGSTILVVLTGALLYIGFDAQLENAIDQALRDRAAEITLDLREGNRQIRAGEPFAVLLEANGQVIDATTIAARRIPVLSARDLARARQHEVVVERRRVTGLGDHGRLLARPERTGDGKTVIVVVGESLDSVNRASQRLGLLLGAASPLLIGMIAWCGWVLAGAALRPVRRMTEEAEAISLRESGQRLRQPPGQDEIAHLGQTLNAMLDRIEASLAHERAFVDDASHELRTPLSILRGELELASARPGDRVGVRRALASALQEAEHLGRLTDDLLVLARADRGRLAARPEPLDLLQAACRSAERPRAADGPAIEVAGQPIAVSADPTLLARVLGNLLANACRHASRTVQVTVARDDESACLTVADDGPGFPPEFLPVAFDRFSRADGVRGRDDGGTGLGLAIADALVRGQGGRVEAGNGAPLGGGRVRVWLPLAPEPARDVPSVAAPAGS